jgi:predicted transcriptional regulator
MSIKPENMHKILCGEKEIELRRTKPRVSEGDLIVFYASSPKRAICGAATVRSVIEGKLCQVWENHATKVGITRQIYNDYYSGCKKAFGIVLDAVWSYNNPIGLEEIRGVLVNFRPPRSFRYLSLHEVRMVEMLGGKELSFCLPEG